MTSLQMQDSRGKSLRDQIQVIQNICGDIDTLELIKSVQPIMTKVKQNESFALEERRQTFRTLALKPISLQIDKIKAKIDENVLQKNEEQNHDLDAQIQQLYNLEDFYIKFSEKLEVFDPLDRNIPA